MNPQNKSASESLQNRVNRNLIEKVIGFSSSKGGVGKSFVCALFACELARLGHRVGILDADLNSSSIPLFFGLKDPVKLGQYSFLPLISDTGVKVISANLLVEDEEHAVIWKEAVAGKVIEKLFKEVEWGELDYLLVDLPPATSELAISIIQGLPLNGVVLVSQPQAIAAKIAAKAIRTIQMINTPIIGIVENMAYTLNLATDEKDYLFGTSHVDSLAAIGNIPLLAKLPYVKEINELCDSGRIEDVILMEGIDLYQSVNVRLKEIESEAKASLTTESETLQHADGQQDIGTDYESEPIQAANETSQYFSDIVIQLIRNQENKGQLDSPTAQGYFLGSCGDSMQIDLQVVNNRILSARFQANGCGATLASGSMITKMACSKLLSEAQQITPENLLSALDGLPEDHIHCAELAVMALREAVIDALEGHKDRTT